MGKELLPKWKFQQGCNLNTIQELYPSFQDSKKGDKRQAVVQEPITLAH